MNFLCKQRRTFPFWMPITGIRDIFTKNLDLACAQEKR